MSAPELEFTDDSRPRKRMPRWIIGFFACLIVIGMVASLIGIWQGLQPQQESEVPPTLSSIDLEVSEVPGNGFGEQQPVWTDCEGGFVCADVQAPLDWADPTVDDTITLRLVKHEATKGTPLGTLFVNPGGPGASGADYVRYNLNSAVGVALQERYDIVGWDPRGVGGSSPVSCFTDAEMDEYLYGADEDFAELERGSDEWMKAAAEESRAFGEACANKTGALLGHVDTASTVHDLDMLREIVGDAKLHYLGYSYGTYIGARYADAYPDKVRHMVLDGAVNPSATLDEVVREQTRGFELALRSYVTGCLAGNDCPLPGTRENSQLPSDDDVDVAMNYVSELLSDVEAEPLTGADGRTFSSGTFLTAIITPLYSQANWGYLNQLFRDVANKNADLGLALADSYYGRMDGKYIDNSTVAFSAINCLDYPNNADPERMRANAEELKKIAPTIGRFQGFGGLSCSEWPYEGVTERAAVQGSGAPTIIVIGTTGDPATPYRWSKALAEQLESGVMLSYEGEGHTAYGKNGCVDQAVEQYFLEDTAPKDGTVCS